MQNLLYPFTYITKSYMATIYPQKDGNNLLGKFSKMQRNILLIFITINNMFLKKQLVPFLQMLNTFMTT